MPLNLPAPKATSSNATSGSSTSTAASPGLALPPVRNSAAASDETHAPTASTSKGGLSLPPPKTKSKAASSGPKKFVLDLPKPVRTASEAATEEDGPAAKRVRTNGSSGLNGLLPEPSRPAAGMGGLKLPEPKSQPTPTGSAAAGQKPTNLLPHMLKGKGKAVEKKAETLEEAKPVQTKPEPELDFFGLATNTSNEPAVDFFNLGAASTSTATPAAVASSTKPTLSAAPSASPARVSSSVKISAAPSTAAPSLSSNYYATLPLPSASDPYPGFYQKADMSWAAKRPDEWEIWAKAQGWDAESRAEAEAALAEEKKKQGKQYSMPSDFDEKALGDSVEIRAAALRDNGGVADTRPSKIPEEDRIKQEQEKMNAKQNEKKFSHAARSRHQLSTLIAAAKDNRAELEDRISQMKANKRTGGSKYGF